MTEFKKLPHLGVIGGTGWPSTNIYLQAIPARVQAKLGGLNSPNISFESRNFAQIDAWMHEGRWPAVQGLITGMAKSLKERSNIDALVILSNTLHKVADGAAMIAEVPLIHIGECTAKITWGMGIDRVGFIGTKFTMQEDFILKHFRDQGIEVFTPDFGAMNGIDDVIFNELCLKGGCKYDSREFLFQQVVKMIDQYDIEGVVLGCTELGLAMTSEAWSEFCCRESLDLKSFSFIDATECHIEAIVEFCCREKA